MKLCVEKFGKNLGIRIPIELAKELQLLPGRLVTCKVEKDQLTIQIPRYDLDTMLQAITPENVHQEAF